MPYIRGLFGVRALRGTDSKVNGAGSHPMAASRGILPRGRTRKLGVVAGASGQPVETAGRGPWASGRRRSMHGRQH